MAWRIRSTSDYGKSWNLVLDDCDTKVDAEIVIKALQFMNLKKFYMYVVEEYHE
jgi:hypothetical protein